MVAVPSERLLSIERVVYVLVLLLFAGARVALWAQSTPKVFSDTASYAGTSVGARVECDFSFWTGIRPFVTPLVHSVLLHNHTAIAVFQSLLGALAWALLALALGRLIRMRALRWAALLLLLGLGLTRPITVWDQAMLSESLAYSVQALLLASLFWLVDRWTLLRAVALLLLVFLWVFLRDSHLYYVLLVALCLLPVGLLVGHWRRLLPVCAALLLLFFVGNTLATASLRWVGNFYNVLTVRLLSYEGSRSYLEARGMPVNEELLALQGELHTADMHHASSFAPLRAWTHTRGKSAYTRFLVSHPRYLLGAPVHDFNALLGDQRVYQARFSAEETPHVLPVWMEEVFYPQRFGFAVACIALVWAVLAGAAVVMGRLPRIVLIPVGLVLLSVPHAWLIWHGDAMEISRHALMPALQIRLGLMLGVFFTLDGLLTGRREARVEQIAGNGKT